MTVKVSTEAVLREIANGLERCGEPLAINFTGGIQIHAADLESWANWIGEFGGSAVDGRMIEHDENYWQHRWANDTVAVICLASRLRSYWRGVQAKPRLTGRSTTTTT